MISFWLYVTGKELPVYGLVGVATIELFIEAMLLLDGSKVELLDAHFVDWSTLLAPPSVFVAKFEVVGLGCFGFNEL